MKKYPYNYLGICITNKDPEYRGRVKIFIPSIMPALYENWNEENKDITLECVGDNLVNGLNSQIIERLEKILPWAECASPIIGSSVGGTYSSASLGGTGQFNQNTNGPDPGTGSTEPGAANFATGAAPTLGGNSKIAGDRQSRFGTELSSSQEQLLSRIQALADREVGSSVVAQQAFIETIVNRAYFSNRSLNTIVYEGAYGFTGTQTATPTTTLRTAFNNVMGGGNLTNLSTDAGYNQPGKGPGGSNFITGRQSSNYVIQRVLDNQTGQWVTDPTLLNRLNTQGDTSGRYEYFVRQSRRGTSAAGIEAYSQAAATNVNINDPTDPPDVGAIGSVTIPFNNPEGNQTYTVPPDPGTPSVTTESGGTLSTGVSNPTGTGDGRGSVAINRVPPAGGSGGLTTGTMTLTLPNGGSRTYNFNNGGYGAGAIPAGEYTISNGRTRNTAGMVVDGVGYSFDLSDKYDPNAGRNRSLLRIHPDGGATGTLGCLGIIGNADVQRQFYADLNSILAANGGRYTTNIVDNLPGTGQPGATSGGTPVLDQPTTMLQHTTQTQASPIDTTGMAQGMFVYPNPGALLWVFFREGDPLFPVYFAASYGKSEWQSAYQAGSAPLYYPAEQDDPSKVVNKTVMRFNAAGLLEANGTVSGEQDFRSLTLAHANGAHLMFHPTGSIHYSPNEHLEQVAGNKYSYRLNSESWTQGVDNKVVLGNQYIKVGNPTQENADRIEQLQAKIKEVNDIMLQS